MGERVTMRPKQPKVEAPVQQKKLTYEELQNVVYQYENQNKYLQEQLKQLNYAGMIQQMGFMFKVLENPKYFTETFVTKCAEGIEVMLALPETFKPEEQGNLATEANE